MKIRDETRISISTDQVSAELNGEAVVLNLKSGVYFGLNPVGTTVWSMLKTSPRSVAELREGILQEYDVGVERCDDDLRALLASLSEHGLIEITE